MCLTLKKAQRLLTSSSNSQWAGFCLLLSLEWLGLSSLNRVAQAQAFATDEKAVEWGSFWAGTGAKKENTAQPPLTPSNPHNMVIVWQWITWPCYQCRLVLRLWLCTRFHSLARKKFNPCKYGISTDKTFHCRKGDGIEREKLREGWQFNLWPNK